MDYESVIRFPKFKMTDLRWRTNIPEFPFSRENWYIGVFRGADYKFAITFTEVKMANLRCLLRYETFFDASVTKYSVFMA